MKPTVFYKYMTSQTAEVVLRNSRLRWSSPTVFNDLAEFQRMPRFEPTISEASRFFPQTLINAASGKQQLDTSRLTPIVKSALDRIEFALRSSRTEAELLAAIGSSFEQPDADAIVEQGLRNHFASLDLKAARVLCLTSTSNNEVMWGTYAENHCGCALGFTAGLVDSPFLEAKPVIYSEERPVAGSGLDFLLYGDSPELRKRTTEAVFYTKKSIWAYEQEWRLLTWRPEEAHVMAGDYIFYPEELESITFGVRVESKVIESISAIVKMMYPATTIFRMSHHQGELSRAAVD